MNKGVNARAEIVMAERARRLAEPPARDAAAERRRVCVVETGGRLYGLEIEDIGRVLPYSAPAPLADAEPSLLGIIARNAGFVLVYDLAGVATGANAGRTSDGHLLLLRHPRPLTALRVDRTLAIQDIEIVSAEEATSLPARTGISGYGRYNDDCIVSIINIAALFKTSARAHSGD